MKTLTSIGSDSQKNDIIVNDIENPDDCVIFFPGDVQDFKSNMEKHRDNYRWMNYCYENTLEYLSKTYEKSIVLMIKPARLHLNTFACYKNFLDCNNFGVATFSLSDTKALSHLSSLFFHVGKSLGNYDDWKSEKFRIHVVGFSKGCSVLNQLVYDVASLEQLGERNDLLEKIESFTWLDSGTSGGSGAWLSDETTLSKFVKYVKTINVHVTPYQVKDKSRKWIREENEKFIEILKTLDCKLNYNFHFENEDPSLLLHFSLLNIQSIH